MTTDVITPPITTATQADAEAISARTNEPAWLREQRIDAWRAYETIDLPDEKDEEWRRTDVRALPFDRLPLAVASQNREDASGVQGVDVSTLTDAVQARAELVQKHLGTAVGVDEWKYLSLTAALWSGGAFVHVAKNVEVAAPVRITQTLAAPGGIAFPRTLIIVERNARVAIIDEARSADDGETSMLSGAVEIFVGDGARVEYYNVNRWGDNVYNFNTVRAMLGRDAEFIAGVAGLGSKLTKMRLDVQMPQPGARTQLLGVTYGDREQHFDYNTRQEHTGDHTISDLQFKSALDDSASLVWYGITRINPPAGGSEANQTSRNLLLSEHAKAAPIPILEIEAFDVAKCSHGATAGPVDEDELFYLQARAIPRRTAEQMLVEGFFADVIDRFPNAQVREQVMDAVLEKLGGHHDTISTEEVLSAV
jgi:Fe-S cluster assembly protein SufD